MLSHPVKHTTTDNGSLLIAWPCDIIYYKGTFVGYVMPRVNSAQDYNALTNATLCRKHFPKVTWKEKVAYAYNLAYAVHEVHDAGHVIGDMNPKNLLVNESGVITVIDTDSFSIYDPDTQTLYPCEVGVEEYLAPEIQSYGKIAGRKFSKESDSFALAVNIFRILMGGYHPFTCKVDPTSASIGETPIQTYIAEGKCPYVKFIAGYSIPPSAPSLDILPISTKELFIEVFSYDASTAKAKLKTRPTPEMWQHAMWHLYSDDSHFKTCNAKVKTEGVHKYYSRLSSCPWCKLSAPIPIPPIPIPKPSGNNGQNTTTNHPSSVPPVKANKHEWNWYQMGWAIINAVLSVTCLGPVLSVVSIWLLYKAKNASFADDAEKYISKARTINIAHSIAKAIILIIAICEQC